MNLKDVTDSANGPGHLELLLKNNSKSWLEGKIKWELLNTQTGEKRKLDDQEIYSLPGDIRIIKQDLPKDLTDDASGMQSNRGRVVTEEVAAEKHMAQLQHNMWVSNARSAVLSIITGGGKWVELTVDADPLYQHLLLTAEKKFWRSVQDGEVPRLFGVEPPRRPFAPRPRGNDREPVLDGPGGGAMR